MRWLITGGCGFLGTSLIAKLRAEGGHAIRVIDNLTVGTRADLAEVCEFENHWPMPSTPMPQPVQDGPVQLVVGDVRDGDLARQVARDVDAIVHLGANTGVLPSIEDPRRDCEANVIGTFNYLDAARLNGIKRFVFASSGAPIGAAEPPIHEGLACRPISPYGASKLAGEAYCSSFAGSFGVGTVALRFGNVYGPRSTHKGSVVAKFIKQALRGETLIIYGDGTQTRDFIYIDDLLNAVVKAAQSDLVGELFQIATNRETTVNEVAEIISEACKELAKIDVKLEYEQPRTGEVQRNYSDITKARTVLGWEPTADLALGVRKTIQFFLDRGEQGA